MVSRVSLSFFSLWRHRARIETACYTIAFEWHNVRLKSILRLLRKSRPNAYETKILSYIIVLHFAVVFMRWWWPPKRANGLRRCGHWSHIFWTILKVDIDSGSLVNNLQLSSSWSNRFITWILFLFNWEHLGAKMLLQGAEILLQTRFSLLPVE